MLKCKLRKRARPVGDKVSLRRRRNKENCERTWARRLCFKSSRGGAAALKLNLICRCGGIGRRAGFRFQWEWFHMGSSPFICTKKVVSFWYDFFYPNRRLGISSRFSVHLISSFEAVYHHSSECIFLRLDDIQCFALMIFSHFVSDDIHFLWKWLDLQAFLFLPVKYKSFNLSPFRSIYGVAFNYWLTEEATWF